MSKRKTISLLVILILGLILVRAQSQTANDILAKSIEALGGAKALEAVKDTTITGTMEMVSMGMNGSITIYSKEPNKMRLDIEVMGMVITQAYDGETAWMINPQTGSTEVMPEQLAQQFKRQAMGNDSVLHPEKYGIAYEFKGKEKLNDKEYFVLEQTFQDGYKITLYIDPETYLTYKSKAKTLNQMGVEVLGETIQSDYKKVDGIMVPHAMTQYQDGQEFMRLAITKVTFNSGLDDSLFKMK